MIWILQVFGNAPSTLEVDGGADGMDFESSNPVALPVDEPSSVAGVKWKLEGVEGEDADEVTAVDEESSENDEDPSHAFHLSPVFAPVTIKFYRSSELQQCVWPISRIYSAT
jgi:hypothetical protein